MFCQYCAYILICHQSEPSLLPSWNLCNWNGRLHVQACEVYLTLGLIKGLHSFLFFFLFSYFFFGEYFDMHDLWTKYCIQRECCYSKGTEVYLENFSTFCFSSQTTLPPIKCLCDCCNKTNSWSCYVQQNSAFGLNVIRL